MGRAASGRDAERSRRVIGTRSPPIYAARAADAGKEARAAWGALVTVPRACGESRFPLGRAGRARGGVGVLAGPRDHAGGATAARSVCGDGIIDLGAGEQCDPGPTRRRRLRRGMRPACAWCAPSGPPFVDPGTNHCYFSASARRPSIDGRGASVRGRRARTSCASSARRRSRSSRAGADRAVLGRARESTAGVGHMAADRDDDRRAGLVRELPGMLRARRRGDGGIPPGPDAATQGVRASLRAADAPQSWSESVCAAGKAGGLLEPRDDLRARAGRHANDACGRAACFTVAATQGGSATSSSPHGRSAPTTPSRAARTITAGSWSSSSRPRARAARPARSGPSRAIAANRAHRHLLVRVLRARGGGPRALGRRPGPPRPLGGHAERRRAGADRRSAVLARVRGDRDGQCRLHARARGRRRADAGGRDAPPPLPVL